MPETEMQKGIVQKHLKDKHPLLDKSPASYFGCSGFGLEIFSAGYEFVGWSSTEKGGYLPHFEFNVGSKYNIEIAREVSTAKTISYESGGMRLQLKPKQGDGLVEVLFPKLPGLFYLKNLARGGRLLSIPQVRDEDRVKLPIDENQVSADFYFKASATSHGLLFARMAIIHPAAEEVIMAYLGAIDRRFADYGCLQRYFKERDDKGRKFGEEQQPKAYKRERKKLNEALFGELTDILGKAGLELHRA